MPEVWITVKYKESLHKDKIASERTVQSLLQEVCTKHSLDASVWALKHAKAGYLDLTATFQTLKLPNNAQLKLINTKTRVYKKVKVALVLESSLLPEEKAPVATAKTTTTRLVASFPANTSLWAILVHFEVLAKANLTNRGDAETKQFQQPVLSINRKDYGDLVVLHKSTLSKIGVTSGSVLARLRHKVSPLLLAHKQKACAELSALLISKQQQYLQDKKTAATQAKINPPTLSDKQIRHLLTGILRSLDSEAGSLAPAVLSLLIKITSKVLQNPAVDRFRSLNLTKATLAAKIAAFPAALHVLDLMGWGFTTQDSKILELQTEHVHTQRIETCLTVLEARLTASRAATATVAVATVPVPVPAAAAAAPRVQEETVTTITAMDTTTDGEEETETAAVVAQTGEGKVNPPLKFTAPLEEDEDVTAEDSDPAPDLAPEYDISDVRAALKLVTQEYASDPTALTKLAVLTLLRKITEKLLTTKLAKFRTINMAKPAFAAVRSSPGCLAYLKFLGFQTVDSDKLVLSPQQENPKKLTRAVVILSIVIKEHTPSEEAQNKQLIGAVSPDLVVFQNVPVAKTTTQMDTTEDGEGDDVGNVSTKTQDQRLFLAEFKMFRDRQKTQDMIITKGQREKMKLAKRRKYMKTVLRIQFNDKVVVQACFSPFDTLETVFAYLKTTVLKPSETKTKYALFQPPVSALTLAQHGQDTLTKLNLVPSGTMRLRYVEKQASDQGNFPAASAVMLPELFAGKLLAAPVIQLPQAVDDYAAASEAAAPGETQTSAAPKRKKKPTSELTEEEKEQQFQAYLAAKKKKAAKKRRIAANK